MFYTRDTTFINVIYRNTNIEQKITETFVSEKYLIYLSRFYIDSLLEFPCKIFQFFKK